VVENYHLQNFINILGWQMDTLTSVKNAQKKDVRNDYVRKSSDEEWMEKERVRGREKYKRLGYVNLKNTTRSDFNVTGASTISKYLRRRGYDTKDKEAHHWNYNLPHSVFLMSRKAHHRIHCAITMSRSDKCCYTNDGVKLETAEQAKKVYEDILKNSGLNEEILLINF